MQKKRSMHRLDLKRMDLIVSGEKTLLTPFSILGFVVLFVFGLHELSNN